MVGLFQSVHIHLVVIAAIWLRNSKPLFGTIMIIRPNGRTECKYYDQVYSLKKQTQLQTTTKTDRQKTNREHR